MTDVLQLVNKHPNRIPSFKRTSQYSDADFHLLDRFVAQFKVMIHDAPCPDGSE